MSNFLSRSEIEAILEGMTARDIFAVIRSGGDPSKGAQVAGDAFEAAASRQGYGEGVLDRVRPKDAIYLAEQLSEVFTSDSPKDGTTGDLPDSSGTGELTPSS